MPATADLHYIPVFSSLAARRQALRDRLHVRDEVAARREDATRFLASGIDMLRHGIECGADKATLQDLAGWLHNAVSSVDGQMRSSLEDKGLYHDWRAIDMSELDQIITTLERGR